ncbi:MAG: bifunctional nuclease family protein [Actinomycetota bacterium]
MTAMVPAEIVGVRLDPVRGASAVVLGPTGDPTRVLPIAIGSAQAHSIASALARRAAPRPNTHDLTASLIAAAGLRLDEVAVTELRNGMFSAEVFVESADGMSSLSARPSDAIALAVRMDAPIFVSADVMNEAGVHVDRASPDVLDDEEIDRVVEEFQQFLDHASAADFADDSSNDG